MVDKNRAAVSSFNGSFRSFFLRYVAWSLFTIATLGLGWAYACKRLLLWMAGHSTVSGRALYFTGRAGSLFVRGLVLILLVLLLILFILAALVGMNVSVVTVISGFLTTLMLFYKLILTGWLAKNWRLVSEEGPSFFTANGAGYLFKILLLSALYVVTLGFGTPWIINKGWRWLANNSVISGHSVIYKGNIADFIRGQRLLFFIFMGITLISLIDFSYKLNDFSLFVKDVRYAAAHKTELIDSSLFMADEGQSVLWGRELILLLFLPLSFYVKLKFFAWMVSQTTLAENKILETDKN